MLSTWNIWFLSLHPCIGEEDDVTGEESVDADLDPVVRRCKLDPNLKEYSFKF